ncbi:MAG: hypothetical protein JNK53_01765 [Phycisphaerae bacterium]|nr:hypothetical protein [Phycisphaerae bacterium]
MSTASVESEIRVAPEDLYWAVLDPAPLGRNAIAPAERGFLLEAEVPVPIESLHVAYAVLPGSSCLLACAIERERLQAITVDGPLSVVPASLPAWLPADIHSAVAPGSLELLHSEFEPRACRRARRTFALVVASSIAVAASVVAFGVAAKSSAIDRAIAAYDDRSEQLTKAALAGAPKRSGLPDGLRLTAELRELRSTRAGDAPTVRDSAPFLAMALAAWPEGTRAHIDSLSVTHRSISLRGQARSAEDYQRVMDALSALPGWRIGPPQFREAKDGYAFNAELAADESVAQPAKGGQP